MIEDLLDFKPIVGNDLICTNPIQSVYKIHGCHTQADSIIITKKDSEEFQEKFSLIKAQLLSLFLHRPIIFIGYNFGDKNILDILNTIFLFVKPNSVEAKKIENNFLFIEWSENENNIDIGEIQSYLLSKIIFTWLTILRLKGESVWDIENFNTNSTYCHYSIATKKHLYTDQWIAFIVAVINAGKFQNAIADYKNKNTKTIDGFLAEN